TERLSKGSSELHANVVQYSLLILLALKYVAQTPNAVPAVAVAFDRDLVLAVRSGLAVFSNEQTYQAGAFVPANIQSDALRPFMEVMDGYQGIVAPLIVNGEDAGIAGFQRLVCSPTEFRTFLS